MKLLIMIFLSVITVYAASIETFAKEMQYETVYQEAVTKAKETGKPIMLVMVTHYCPWCRKYERDTLSKKAVNQLVAKKYIPLVLNREAGKFPKKFDTPRIPTTFFIDAKGDRVIYSDMGYKTKAEFFEMEAKVKP